MGTLERFYGNTVEIPENSENHLKAIVGDRQVAGRDGFRARAGKVVEKPQGEEKAAKNEARSKHSAATSADYIDLREIGDKNWGQSRLSPVSVQRVVATMAGNLALGRKRSPGMFGSAGSTTTTFGASTSESRSCAIFIAIW